MKDLPSEEELFAGRMKDGSRPPMYSKELYEKHVVDGFGRPLPEELREKTAEELTAAELEFEADLMLLDDYDFCRDMGRFLANTGCAALEDEDGAPAETPKGSDPLGGSGSNDQPDLDDEADADSDDQSRSDYGDSPQPRGQSPDDADSDPDDQPQSDDGIGPIPFPYKRGARPVRGGKAVVPESPVKPTPLTEQQRAKQDVKRAKLMQRRLRAQKNSKRRASKATIRNLTKAQASSLIHHGCKMIASVAEKRAEVFKRLIKHAMQQDLKEAFYWDRAHAVVAATLLHLDKEFEDVGFGSWMPFRFPDQWLMFCGVMRRVLAANGLLHGTDPEDYRKFFEETPYPTPEIENIDERIKWWKTPENWSTLWTNRGARTMEILKQRLMDEVWDPTTQFGGQRAPPPQPGR